MAVVCGGARQADTSTNLADLVNRLERINARWRDLGIQFGFTENDLRGIQQGNPFGGVQQWMTTMLEMKLSRSPGFGWQNVKEALINIGCRELAESKSALSIALAIANDTKLKFKFAALSDHVCTKLEKEVEPHKFRTIAKAIWPAHIIPNSSNVREMFDAITDHKGWNYLHYRSLERVVTQFKITDEETEQKLADYAQSLHAYSATLKIIDWIEKKDIETMSNIQQPPLSPQSYSKLSIKLHPCKVKDKTLEYVRELWQDIAKEPLDQPDLDAVLYDIKEGCVFVTWLIPTSKELKRLIRKRVSVCQDFFRRHKIVQFMVNDECIYKEKEQSLISSGDISVQNCPLKETTMTNSDHENVGPKHKRGRLYSTDASVVDTTVPYEAAQMASTHLEDLLELDICRETEELLCVRKTGIVCTIGPACNNVQVLEDFVEAGLSVARLNLTHFYSSEDCKSCEEEAKKRVVETIQNIKNAGKTVAIALDTKGREIRTGFLKGDSVPRCHCPEGKSEKEAVVVEIKEGSELRLSTEEKHKYSGDESIIYVDHKKISRIVNVGDLVYIDEGRISLKVTATQATYLSTEVVKGGPIKRTRGLNLPGKKVDLPVLTEQDKVFLQLGVEQDVDMVFASFVQDKEDVEAIREALGDEGSHILVISKIESKEGLCNFNEILRASDGIMVARGDLGIEIPQEKVFIAQKMMISRCNRAGKPVIVATQMLDNMIKKQDPTRAELSDIANAVLDGADYVTLSEETAIGDYPVKALAVMSKVAQEAEAVMFHHNAFNDMCQLTPTPTNPPTIVEATAIAAVNTSLQMHAAAIVTVTISGKTAFVLSQYHPHCPIIAVTRNSHTARICQLHNNVYPLLCKESLSEDEWLENMEEKLMEGVEEGRKKGFIKQQSNVVLLSGCRPGPHHINTMRIIKVEEATVN